jgi:hypothetical protein
LPPHYMDKWGYDYIVQDIWRRGQSDRLMEGRPLSVTASECKQGEDSWILWSELFLISLAITVVLEVTSVFLPGDFFLILNHSWVLNISFFFL